MTLLDRKLNLDIVPVSPNISHVSPEYADSLIVYDPLRNDVDPGPVAGNGLMSQPVPLVESGAQGEPKQHYSAGVGHSVAKYLRNRITELGVLTRLPLTRLGVDLPYEAVVLDEADKDELRHWIAAVYVQNKIAKEEDLQSDGTLVDSYRDRSTYYGVRDTRTGELLIGARLIATKDDDPDTLQMRLETLSTEAQQERVRALGGAVVEFASYIKKPGISPLASRLASLVLIKHMIQESLDDGATHHVFGLNPNIASTYERLFGNAMESLGDSVKLGKLAIDFKPYILDLAKRVRDARTSTRGSLASWALGHFFGAIQLPSEKDAQSS